MRYEVGTREVHVDLTDAEPVTGTAGYSGTERKVRPLKVQIKSVAGEPGYQFTVSGPTVKADGSDTASYYKVQLTSSARRQWTTPAPQWLVDIADEVFGVTP